MAGFVCIMYLVLLHYVLALRKQVIEISEAPSKAKVVIVGNVGSGKSTLCQFLLAKTDVCKVAPGGGGRETTELELASGYWFNDASLGELEVLDTPGFQHNELDGEAWVQFADFVKENMSTIDALIFTAYSVSQLEFYEYQVVDKLRQSFGSDIWQNLALFVSVKNGWQSFDHSLWTGLSEGQWTALEDHWNGRWTEVEFNRSVTDWTLPEHAESRQELEQDMSGIFMLGCYLKVKDGWPMVGAHNAYDNTRQMVQSRINLLTDLRSDILGKRTTREGGGAWDIQHLQPRFGPSEVNADQQFECKWPYACTVHIKGKYLSNQDRVQIFPKGHRCGDDFAGFGVSGDVQPVAHSIALPRILPEEDNKTKIFDLGATAKLDLGVALEKEYRICYCEFGSCTSPKRFGHEVGTLTVRNTMCQVPCHNETLKSSKLLSGTCGPEEYINLHDEVVYQCHLGHGLHRDPSQNQVARKCTSGGSHQDGNLEQLAQCPRVECPQLASPGNSEQRGGGSNFYYLDVVTFTCDSGYTMDANPRGKTEFHVQCNAQAQWEFHETQQPRETWQEFLADGGCRRWKAEAWQGCNASCGEGKDVRTVTCDPKADTCNTLAKPDSAKDCVDRKGCICGRAPDLSDLHARFAYSDTQEPPMITGESSVFYECDYHNGYTLDGSSSTSYALTSFQVSCDMAMEKEWTKLTEPKLMARGQLEAACRKWEITDWSPCSVTCESGYQFRKIQCSTGDDADCPEEERPKTPALSKPCYVGRACYSSADERYRQGGNARESTRGVVLAWFTVSVVVLTRVGA